MRPAAAAAAILRPAVYTPQTYGAIADGVADDSDAINEAIQAAYDAGGGVVHFAKGTYLCASAITMPDDGNATKPLTVPIKLQGVGPQWTGRNSVTTTGGSVLNITATDTYGKLKTKGVGWLGIEGLTFKDTAETSTPFVYTTNTTLDINQCAFIGSKDATACDQDAIICGGTLTPEGGDWDDAFQGYGTVISRNYFNHIRRAVYGRCYFNGNIIRDNTIWAQSGNASGACIELEGSPGVGESYCTGNVVSGNLIETYGYDYGIDLGWSTGNMITNNNFFDAGAGTLHSVRLQANAIRNTVIQGYDAEGITDLGTDNTILSNLAGAYNFMGPTKFLNDNYPTVIKTLEITDNGAGLIVQPAVATSDASDLIIARRSAAESSNPGTDIFVVRQRGDVVLGGASAGSVTFQSAAGTATAALSNGGKTWTASGTGGTMKIDTGTGGSYLTLQAYGLKVQDHTGSNIVTVKSGTGTPENALAANVGSLFLRTDGGAGTCLYVKESGTGNTGWKAVTTS